MLKPFFAIAGILLLTGCEMLDQMDRLAPVRDPDAPVPVFADTSWRLTAIDSQTVSRAGAGSTLTFGPQGDGATGTGPCNVFGATVEVDGTSLSFEPVFVTERACLPSTRMVAEEAYFRALREAATFEATPTDLWLFDATGEEVLRFAVAPTAPVQDGLIGTSWSLGDLEGSAAFGLAHLAFGENGELDGQGPCNTFAGDYRLGEGNAVEIMPRKTTRCFCGDFDREGQFLDALRRVRDWRIDGERLLLGADGTTLMILERARAAPIPLRGC